MSSNIDNSQSDNIVLPVSPPINFESPSTPTTDTPDIGVSTLATSEASASMVTYASDTPTLPPPGIQIDISMSEIANRQLDAWLASQEEEKNRVREWLNSPKFLAFLQTQGPAYRASIDAKDPNKIQAAVLASPEYQAWLAGLSPTDRASQPSLQPKAAMRVGEGEGLSGYRNPVAEAPPTAASLMPMVAATVLLGVVSAGTSAVQQIAHTTSTGSVFFDQVWMHVGATIDSNMAATLGYIGGLFMMSLVLYQKEAGPVDGATGGKKAHDLNFALDYTKTLVKKLSGNDFTLFVKGSLLNKLEGGAQLSEERKDQLVAIVKIALLAASLVLIYKTETGKITDQEFAAMLTGQIPFAEGDIRGTVVNLINSQLQLVPRSERLRLMQALLAFADSNPNVHHLTKPGKVFEHLFKNFDVHRPIADR